MANPQLFKTTPGEFTPPTDTVNEAGGKAYAFSDKHALAQLAATGCLNDTYYAEAADQLTNVLALTTKVDPEFIAKTALYAREAGFMKDMPALLCAILSVRSPRLLELVFPRVIDSPKMLRNFVQIMRSGVVGRKSLGSLPKRLILNWLKSKSDASLFRAAIGESPSLADIVKMVHPIPATPQRAAFYGWLLGKTYNAENLDPLIRNWEAFKTNPLSTESIPDVPFQYLASLDIGVQGWTHIAKTCTWQTLRMNLNTFLRHGVFKDPEMVTFVAARLGNKEEVLKAKVFPYQLLAAYMNAKDELPAALMEGLQVALDVSIENVPMIEKNVAVMVDISGSMQSPITGQRKGSTSKVRCVDVAALMAATMMKRCAHLNVALFNTELVQIRLNQRDSVLTNAKIMASKLGGGTDCSAPMRAMNELELKADLIVYVSDNQSWFEAPSPGRFRSGSDTMYEWNKFRIKNPTARMVCIDIQPVSSSHSKPGPNIMNVGGFNDRVFDLVVKAANGEAGQDHWIKEIEAVALTPVNTNA